MHKLFAFTLCLSALLLFDSLSFGAIELGVLNQIQFDDRETFVNTNGNLVFGDIGDRLVGVLNANTINTINGTQNPVTPEITGVFDMTIAGFVKKTDNTAYMLLRPTNVTGGEGALAGHTAGTAIAFYTGGVNLTATLNDSLKTTADAFAAASDGAFIDDFGFGKVAADGTSAFDSFADWGAAGNGYWYAEVTALAGFVGAGTNALTSLSASSTFYYGLEGLTAAAYVGLGNTDLGSAVPTGTLIEDNREDPSLLIVPTTLFDLTGKGATKINSIVSSGVTAADAAKFPIFSNDPARLQPMPEPTTFVAWAGFISICATYFGHKRRSKLLGV